MLENIRDHSFMVARVAERIHATLSQKLATNTLPPLELLQSGALLHDIAKTECLRSKRDHAEMGAQICHHHGYPNVAEIVAEHVRLLRYEPARYEKGLFLAKEIIFYSDKRVIHDSIVSLSERLEYILERYGNNDAKRHDLIRHNFNSCKELEGWLCKHACASPEELLAHVDHTPYTVTA